MYCLCPSRKFREVSQLYMMVGGLFLTAEQVLQFLEDQNNDEEFVNSDDDGGRELRDKGFRTETVLDREQDKTHPLMYLFKKVYR